MLNIKDREFIDINSVDTGINIARRPSVSCLKTWSEDCIWGVKLTVTMPCGLPCPQFI